MTWISRMPSGKLTRFAVHDHCDTGVPGMRGAGTSVSVRQWIEFWSTLGAVPLPDMLNESAFVTLLQSIGRLNSSEICTVVAFASPVCTMS